MKQAYVSVVIPVLTAPGSESLMQLDRELERNCRAHEIVLVLDRSQSLQELPPGMNLQGPLTCVRTHDRSSRDAPTLAGLARSVGDFVIEWHGPLDYLSHEVIDAFLEGTNEGFELVEIAGNQSWSSKFFYSVVNVLRPKGVPVRKSIARVFSRRAANQVIASAAFDDQLSVLVAEIPVARMLMQVPCEYVNSTWGSRLAEGFSLLSKGSRFGTAIPLLLASLSAIFGLAAALYAVLILVIRGRTPEGWTTLMVVSGLGQAAILSMMGLTWSRISSLARGLTRSIDVTTDVEVWPPSV